MEFGLLWFDNSSQRELEEKVRRAAAHYERKYGCAPNVCFVHPAMLDGNGKRTVKAGDVAIHAGRAILLDHFWIGVEEQETSRKSRAGRGMRTAAARSG
jgi:hypothetical protein